MKTATLQTPLTPSVALNGGCNRGFRCASLAHQVTNCARLAQNSFKKLPGLADGSSVGNDEAGLTCFIGKSGCHRSVQRRPVCTNAGVKDGCDHDSETRRGSALRCHR